MKRTLAAAVGVALSLGLAAAVVNAQPYGYGMGGGGPGYGMHGYGMGYGMGPGYGMGQGMGPGYGMGYGNGSGYGAGPQGRFGGYAGTRDLTELRAELGITDKQEPAWKAFVNSTKREDEDRQAWFEQMREARAAGSLPELLAKQNAIAKQHQADREATTAALKGLYAALTPEQKAVADERLGGFAPGYSARGSRGGPGGRFR